MWGKTRKGYKTCFMIDTRTVRRRKNKKRLWWKREYDVNQYQVISEEGKQKVKKVWKRYRQEVSEEDKQKKKEYMKGYKKIIPTICWKKFKKTKC